MGTAWGTYPLIRMVTSFNMVAFFLLSGYLLSFSSKRFESFKDITRHIGRRFVQCYVPIVAWNSLKYYFLYPEEQYGFGEMASVTLCYALWFLRCLWICDVVLTISVWLAQKVHIVVGAILLVVTEIVSFGLKDFDFFFNVYYYLPFLTAGFMGSNSRIIRLLTSRLCFAVCLSAYILLVARYNFSGTSILVRYPLALFGSIAFFFICKNIHVNANISQLVCSLGRATLPIYCMHFFFLKGVDAVWVDWQLLNFVILGTLAFILAFICLAISKVLSYSLILDVMFNGKFPPNK